MTAAMLTVGPVVSAHHAPSLLASAARLAPPLSALAAAEAVEGEAVEVVAENGTFRPCLRADCAGPYLCAAWDVRTRLALRLR